MTPLHNVTLPVLVSAAKISHEQVHALAFSLEDISTLPGDGTLLKWSERTLALLAEVRASANQSFDEAKSLPYASLRLLLQVTCPDAICIDGGLSFPRQAGASKSYPFMEVPTAALAATQAAIRTSMSSWINSSLRKWATKVQADAGLIDALLEAVVDGSAIKVEACRVAQPKRWLDTATNQFSEIAAAALRQAVQRIRGQEIFPGLGPVFVAPRIRQGSNFITFKTFPTQVGGVYFSMRLDLSVETAPGLNAPIVTVRVGRDRWLTKLPNHFPVRSIHGWIMRRGGPLVAASFDMQVTNGGPSISEDMTFVLSALSMKLPLDLAPAGMVGEAAMRGDVFVGIPYAPIYGERFLKVGNGASTSDATFAFQEVGRLMAHDAWREISFSEVKTATNRRRTDQMPILDLSTQMEDFAAEMQKIGLLEEGAAASIDDFLKLPEDMASPEIPEARRDSVAAVNKLRKANADRMSRAYPDGLPALICLADSRASQSRLRNIIKRLFGSDLSIVTMPLPADVHNARKNLPGSDLKATERFNLRKEAWRSTAELIAKDYPNAAVIVQAADWYDGQKEDLVNKRAGRHSLASIGAATVQYLLPLGRGKNAVPEYLIRVQMAVYDLLFGHSGLISPVEADLTRVFGDAPPHIVGVSVITTARQAKKGQQPNALCVAFRIKAKASSVEIRLPGPNGMDDGGWMPLRRGLQIIASRTWSMGEDKSSRSTYFQRFVRALMEECECWPNGAVMMIESRSARGLWPWLNDPKIKSEIDADGAFSILSESSKVRVIRVRTGSSAPIITFKKAVHDVLDRETGEVLDTTSSGYATIESKLIQLKSQGALHFWFTTGYPRTQQVKRGLSVYRHMPSSKKLPDKTIEFALREPYLPPYRLPGITEITLAKLAQGDDPGEVAGLVALLRSGFGHTMDEVLLPAPLFYERKVRDYITAIEDDESDEESIEEAISGEEVGGDQEDDVVRMLITQVIEELTPASFSEFAFKNKAYKTETSIPSQLLGAPKASIKSDDQDKEDRVMGSFQSKVDELAFMLASSAGNTDKMKAPEFQWARRIKLPSYVTPEWMAQYHNILPADLRALQQYRNSIKILSGHEWTVETKKDKISELAFNCASHVAGFYFTHVFYYKSKQYKNKKENLFAKSFFRLHSKINSTYIKYFGSKFDKDDIFVPIHLISDLHSHASVTQDHDTTLAIRDFLTICLFSKFSFYSNAPLYDGVLDAAREIGLDELAEYGEEIYAFHKWQDELFKQENRNGLKDITAPMKTESKKREEGVVDKMNKQTTEQIKNDREGTMEAHQDSDVIAEKWHQIMGDIKEFDGQAPSMGAAVKILESAHSLVQLAGDYEKLTKAKLVPTEPLLSAISVMTKEMQEDNREFGASLKDQLNCPKITEVTQEVADKAQSHIDAALHDKAVLQETSQRCVELSSKLVSCRDPSRRRQLTNDLTQVNDKSLAAENAVEEELLNALLSIPDANEGDSEPVPVIENPPFIERPNGIDVDGLTLTNPHGPSNVLEDDGDVGEPDPAPQPDETLQIDTDPIDDDDVEEVVEVPKFTLEVEIPDLQSEAGEIANIYDIQISAAQRRLVGMGKIGLAYHLGRAGSPLCTLGTMPFSKATLKLAAIGSSINPLLETSDADLQKDVLNEAQVLRDAGGKSPDVDDATTALYFAGSIERAVLYRDSTAAEIIRSASFDDSRLNEEMNDLKAVVTSGQYQSLQVNPDKLADLARDVGASDAVREDLLKQIKMFESTELNFGLGNKIRDQLTRGTGKVGALRDTVDKGTAIRVELARAFGQECSDRYKVLDLLTKTEGEFNNRVKGLEGAPRERFVSYLLEMGRLATEYAERESSRTDSKKGTPEQHLKSYSEAAVKGLERAIRGLDKAVQTVSPVSAGAMKFAKSCLEHCLTVLRGNYRSQSVIATRMKLHGELLSVPDIHFSSSWNPSLQEPEQITSPLVDAANGFLKLWQLNKPEEYKAAVLAMISKGQMIGAAILLDAGDIFGIKDIEVDALRSKREEEIVGHRKKLASLIDQAQRGIGQMQRAAGTQAEQESAAMLAEDVGRISLDVLPIINSAMDLTEEDETVEAIVDFSDAYRLVNSAIARARQFNERPRRLCEERLNKLKGQVDETVRSRILELVNQEDLITAEEYLDLLEKGMELPRGDEKNLHLSLFFPQVPDGMRGATMGDVEAAIRQHKKAFGLPYDDLPRDRQAQALDIVQSWRQLHRIMASGSPDPVALSNDLKKALELMGMRPKKLAPLSEVTFKLKKQIGYSAQLEIPQKTPGNVILPEFGAMIDGHFRLHLCQKPPTEAEITQFINKVGGDMPRLILVTSVVDADQRRRYLALARKPGALSAPFLVLDDALIAYAAAQPEWDPEILFACMQPFSMSSPFNDYDGKVPPEVFVGRSDQLDKLWAREGACVVYGGRRLGKTAVLHHLAHVYHKPDNGIHCVHLSIRELGESEPDLDKLWKDASTKIGAAVFPAPVETAEKFDEGIRKWLGAEPGRRIVLMLDEADEFIRRDSEQGYRRLISIQKIMEASSKAFKVIFAGNYNVTRLARTGNPPIQTILKDPIRIGPFYDRDYSEAERLVTRPFAALGYEFKSRDLVWRILAHTGYMPVLVQTFCKKLLARMLARPMNPKKNLPVEITEADVKDALGDKEIAEQIQKVFKFTIELDPRYQFIAMLIASHEMSTSGSKSMYGMETKDIVTEAAYFWKEVYGTPNGEEDVLARLDEMEGLGLIRKAGHDHWVIRSRSIRDQLGKRQDIDDRIAEFGRLHPLESIRGFLRPGKMRRRIKASDKPNDDAPGPLTNDQEYAITKGKGMVHVVFGNQEAEIASVKVQISDALSSKAYVSPRISSLDSLVNQLQGAINKGYNVLLVGPDTDWTADWVKAVSILPVLRKDANTRKDNLRVLFVGNEKHARLWSQVQKEPEYAVVHILAPWAPEVMTLQADHMGFPRQENEELIEQSGCWGRPTYNLMRMIGSATGAQRDAKVKDWTKGFKKNATLESFGLSDRDLAKLVRTMVDYGEPIQYGEIDVFIDTLSLNKKSAVRYLELMGVLHKAGFAFNDGARGSDPDFQLWRVDDLVRHRLQEVDK